MANLRPPLQLLLIWAIKFLDIDMILFWTKGGLPISPTIDQFRNFTTISSTKCKLKGGLFLAKNVRSWNWGPTMPAVLDKWGCLPISPKWTNLEFFQQFLVQIEIEKWYVFWKILPQNNFWSVSCKKFLLVGWFSSSSTLHYKKLQFIKSKDHFAVGEFLVFDTLALLISIS